MCIYIPYSHASRGDKTLSLVAREYTDLVTHTKFCYPLKCSISKHKIPLGSPKSYLTFFNHISLPKSFQCNNFLPVGFCQFCFTSTFASLSIFSFQGILFFHQYSCFKQFYCLSHFIFGALLIFK